MTIDNHPNNIEAEFSTRKTPLKVFIVLFNTLLLRALTTLEKTSNVNNLFYVNLAICDLLVGLTTGRILVFVIFLIEIVEKLFDWNIVQVLMSDGNNQYIE